MSKSKLSLIPHIVEDYCRLKCSGLESYCDNNFHDIQDSEAINKHKIRKNSIVRKIEIEIIPDCGNITRRSNVSKKPLNISIKFNNSDILSKPSSSPFVRKKFVKDYRYMMKQKEAQKQKAAIFQRLAIPKLSSDTTKSSWKLTKALKNYKPSNRLLELAKLPMCKGLLKPTFIKNLNVRPSALKYNATPRIQQLAFPRAPCNVCEKADPFKVSPEALRAKLSQHVKQLAYPKRRVDRHQRKHPFKVKKRALSAKPSKLIQKLAIPKGTMSMLN